MAHLRATRPGTARPPRTACKHTNGTYPAEEVDDNGTIRRHHRCNDCHIIIKSTSP